jgi:hypothetical protein
MRLILNYYRDRALWNSRPNSVRVSFVGMGNGRRLQNIGRCMGRIARSHSGWCWPHKGTSRLTQMKTRDLSTQVAKCIELTVDFRKCIVQFNKSVNYVRQTSHLNIKLKLKWIKVVISLNLLPSICRLKQLCLGNHSELATCSQKLFPHYDRSFLLPKY